MAPLPPQKGLSETLRAETQQLRTAWQRHSAAFLDTYLVRDVEDPRINIQSILTRHFLLRELFGDRYETVMEHELTFALLVQWILGLLKSTPSRDAVRLTLGDVLDALLDTNPCTDSTVPPFIGKAFGTLAFPNYISSLLMWVPSPQDDASLPEYLLDTFCEVWAELLENEQARPIRVLEPACGSANDYRFLARCGIARFLEYTGFDLCEINIANARRHFPDVDFRVASVFDIPAADKAYDCCFVHDLLEHLSPEGIDRAMTEMCRVTRVSLLCHFFNMHDAEEDVIVRKDGYHWNRLSCQKMQKRLALPPSGIENRHLATWLKRRFGYCDYYNPHAHSWRIDVTKTERKP